LINCTNLAKRYGARALFENVSIQFDPGKRYGIVGANGAGKSTLLRIINDEETADEGEVVFAGKIKIGSMNQDHFAFEDVPIMDVVMKGKPELANAFEEKERILDDESVPPERIAELEEVIAHNDGYVAEARISEMLEGLGIPTEKHLQPMRVLSGGYKLRVLLGQCLFSDPEVLLLDEPTNHLDIFSIRWLEEYLRGFKGVVIMVSHDREFLNRVCTHIADVDYNTIKIYSGNYDQFLEAKQLDVEMREHEAAKAEKKIGELQAFVTKFKAKASKARQAQSKAKTIERMEKGIEAPVYSSRISPRIKFEQCRPTGRMVVEVEGLSKSFGDKQVLKNVTFKVFRGDKIAIIGPNGVGKSTLLKILMNALPSDGGTIEWGHETHPQYFSQDHHEELARNTSPYEWLYQWAPTEPIGAIRGTLGNVLFSGDDVHKSTTALSGGESARLVLAKLMLLKGNILVMDEPTNHLDMESIEALVDALAQFEGTILLVSHNRYVVNKVATKVLEIRPDGIDLFDGSYQEFLLKVGNDHLSYQVDLGTKVKDKKEAKKEKKSFDYQAEKERKRKQQDARRAFQKEAKSLLKDAETAEADIEKLEASIEEIDDLFSDPNYFNKTSPDEVRKQNDRKRDLEGKLEKVFAKWESLNQQLEALREEHGIKED
jgi:ATPase subunit of ABC transporter with duplicated ATPase domains